MTRYDKTNEIVVFIQFNLRRRHGQLMPHDVVTQERLWDDTTQEWFIVERYYDCAQNAEGDVTYHESDSGPPQEEHDTFIRPATAPFWAAPGIRVKVHEGRRVRRLPRIFRQTPDKYGIEVDHCFG